MRTTIGLMAVVAAIAAVLAAIIAYRNAQPQPANGRNRVHVVLIGASIGQTWRLAEWPARARAPGFSAESVAAWQFDKTAALEEVLIRPASKFRFTRTCLRSLLQPPERPDIIILKECSSYFPGDLRAYRDSMRRWARQIQQHNVRVMLATVAPVTRTRAISDPGKQEALLEFNRWLREFAREKAILLLDLEQALGGEGAGSYLLDDLAMPDGAHLKSNAYDILDRTLRDVLCRTPPVLGCAPMAEKVAAR